ncbi:hypothetical protein, partial [Bacillus thuringiensis]|uniref:hypothetical protein n=1 Tax=Bacillus thuringiensis TaxID=1428 RepID=UPI002175960D
ILTTPSDSIKYYLYCLDTLKIQINCRIAGIRYKYEIDITPNTIEIDKIRIPIFLFLYINKLPISPTTLLKTPKNQILPKVYESSMIANNCAIRVIINPKIAASIPT